MVSKNASTWVPLPGNESWQEKMEAGVREVMKGVDATKHSNIRLHLSVYYDECGHEWENTGPAHEPPGVARGTTGRQSEQPQRCKLCGATRTFSTED